MPETLNLVSLLIPIVTALFTAVSAIVGVRFGMGQLRVDVSEIKETTSANDKDHDIRLANHDKRIAVNETKILGMEQQSRKTDSALEKLNDKIDLLLQRNK